MILMSTKHSRAAGRQGSRNSDQYPGESITGIPFRRAGNSRYGIAQTGEDGRSTPGCPVGRGCSGVVSPVVIKSILQSVFFDKSALVASSAQLAVDIFSVCYTVAYKHRLYAASIETDERQVFV